jgi:ketosteroid isomerase-like protein
MTPADAAILDAIGAASQQFMDAVRRGDGAAVAGSYTEDGRCCRPTAMWSAAGPRCRHSGTAPWTQV